MSRTKLSVSKKEATQKKSIVPIIKFFFLSPNEKLIKITYLIAFTTIPDTPCPRLNTIIHSFGRQLTTVKNELVITQPATHCPSISAIVTENPTTPERKIVAIGMSETRTMLTNKLTARMILQEEQLKKRRRIVIRRLQRVFACGQMKEGENSLCYEIYIKDYEKDKEIQAGDN